MKKLITANDIREAHARGKLAMSVVLRASIITPEAREVADLLGFTITECDERRLFPPAHQPIKPKASASVKPLSPNCRKVSLPKAWSRS